MVATGGTRSLPARLPAQQTSHSLEPPVPSLFTFKVDHPLLRDLQGISVPWVAITHGATRFRVEGPVLITHWGLSGPAVLKLSAWQARSCAESSYRFEVRLNWLGDALDEEVQLAFAGQRAAHGSRGIATRSPFPDLPRRLWARMAELAGVPAGATWSELSRSQAAALVQTLLRSTFHTDGKSLNKEEFVTCGGVCLGEVDLKTMESRRCPGLYFAGEVLDIDGVTGGFNFQSAWTTGRIAGEAMAKRHLDPPV
jgi:predicted Rossmann fold flavoprotein